MLRSMKDLEDCAIGATDGTIGHVKDFYFDDHTWVIRYLVVDTGTWLESRKVLISPFAIGEPDWAKKILPVSLTKEKVKNSPEIDTQKPVSRQYEQQYLGYYGYPLYWGGTGLWGEGLYPNMMMPGYAGLNLTPNIGRAAPEWREPMHHKGDDPHLRSCQAIIDHHMSALSNRVAYLKPCSYYRVNPYLERQYMQMKLTIITCIQLINFIFLNIICE